MNMTYKAVTIIGCRIDRSRIFIEEKHRCCDHEIETIEYKKLRYCPECGKKWTKIVEEPIPQYDMCANTIDGFEVFCNNTDDHIFVAGGFVSVNQYRDMSGEMLTSRSIDVAFKNLRNALKPLKLWDNGAQFGIWPFLSIVYEMER